MHSLLTHSRPKHAWYPDRYFVRIDSTKRGEKITFRSQPTTDRIENHPTLAGQRKLHWMALFILKTPVNADTAYQFDLDATAQAGSLAVDVRSGNHVQTALVQQIGKNQSRIRRRVVFAPLWRDRKTKKIAPPPPDAESMITIYLTWRPDTDKSPLSGSCRVRRLEFMGKAVSK